MLYDLEQGPTELLIIQQARRQRMPLPDRIKNAPVLTTGLEFYYAAFWNLSSCRSIGMAEGPIPWTAINHYALSYGMSRDDAELLERMVFGMDSVYLKFRDRQSSKKTGVGAKASAPAVAPVSKPRGRTTIRKPT